MELKTWLMIVRVFNCISATLLIAFQVWYLIQLFTQQGRKLYGILLRIWAPFFVILIGVLIISSQFKYEKIVQNFKFLQWIPGLALFNLFIASFIAFQFSTFNNQVISIVLASIFIGFSFVFLILNFLKPVGSRGLLSEQCGIIIV